MNIRLFIFIIILLALAVAEVVTTGSVYNYFGAWKLVGIYVVTTTLGAAILISQNSFMKEIGKCFNDYGKNHNLQDEMDDEKFPFNEFSPEMKDRISLLMQMIMFYTAWVSIIIPGLITDLFSYILIVIILFRKNTVGKLL